MAYFVHNYVYQSIMVFQNEMTKYAVKFIELG